MNLSQILNPPAPASTSYRESRLPSTPARPHGLSSPPSAVFHIEDPSKPPTRKHPPSQTMSQLPQDQHSLKTDSGPTATISHDTNHGFSTHTFRANPFHKVSSKDNPAKRKPVKQTLAEAKSTFHLSPGLEPELKSNGRKKKAKTTSNSSPEVDRLEIRFVVNGKEGQAQAAQEQQSRPPKASPQATLVEPSEEEGSQDDKELESSPAPDFERNADGKFRCSWPRCGKEFTVASRLSTHFRIHSGKPPYLCGYKDCQKAFHTSSSLSHHRVVHTDQGLRPYVCRHNRCGATYTQLARLITHQRTTHSGMILFIPQESSPSSPAQNNESPDSLSDPSTDGAAASPVPVAVRKDSPLAVTASSASPDTPPRPHPEPQPQTQSNTPGPIRDSQPRKSNRDAVRAEDGAEEETLEEENEEMRMRREAAMTIASLRDMFIPTEQTPSQWQPEYHGRAPAHSRVHSRNGDPFPPQGEVNHHYHAPANPGPHADDRYYYHGQGHPQQALSYEEQQRMHEASPDYY